MKKVLMLSIVFLAIALVPQSLSAQTNTQPAAKQKVISTKKGNVVPVRKAKSKKTDVSSTIIRSKPMANPHTPVSKEARKDKAVKMEKQKAAVKTEGDKKPVEMIIKPLKNPDSKAKKLNKAGNSKKQ